jgi:two-component sensor histidine kinase
VEDIVGHDAGGPRIWLSQKKAFRDEQGRVIGLVGSSTDITARKRAEESRQLLVRELNHRVKNLFAVASGMVSMTARNAATVREMAEALNGRLLALAQAHELIRPAVTDQEASGSDGADLQELVTALTAPHLLPGRDQLRTGGPAVKLGPSAATSLALILHELATNAAKYGALSVAEGSLEIAWRTDEARLMLSWRESNGPLIAAAPRRKGFGSQLARMSAGGQLGGSIEYAWSERGVEIGLTVPLDRLQR